MRAAKPFSDFKAGEEVEGVVNRVANIGVWINIGAPKDALLPKAEMKGSQFAKGDKLSGLIITEVNDDGTPQGRSIKVTMSKPIASAAVGDIMDGKVTNVAAFGVFFNIGLTEDALVPTRLLASDDAELKVGDTKKVKIIEISGGKITGATDMDAAVKEEINLEVGDKVSGTVNGIESFGVFVEIAGQTNAIIRANQLEKAIDTYSVGDQLTGLRVIVVDKEKGQIACSMRPFPDDMSVGDKLEATVISINEKFGVFMDAGLAYDVLAPNKFLVKPASEYSVGEVVDVVIKQISGDRITVDTRGDSPLGNIVRGTQVSGTVIKVVPNLGVLIDAGLGAKALLREKLAPKAMSEYKENELIEGLVVTEVDEERETIIVCTLDAPFKKGASLADLEIGQPVSGTVKRVTDFGVFIDVGAERDALLVASQMQGAPGDYKAGQDVAGLKISSIDISQSRLAVTTKLLAEDFTVGQDVTGSVTKKMAFGLFVNIGASNDCLLPTQLLGKDLDEYEVGEEIAAKVIDVTPRENKITIGQKERGSLPSLVSEQREMSDLVVGEKIDGIVRMARDYGVFVDIGLGRRDALLPASQLPPEMAPTAYKQNDTVEVYIGQVDLGQQRVTLSLEPPGEGGMQSGVNYGNLSGGEAPPGEQLPDLDYWKALQGITDENPGRVLTVSDEPILWDEWEKKFPGLVHFAAKEVELYGPSWSGAYQAVKQIVPASVHYMKIPEHLRKPDAQPAVVPEHDFDDYPLTHERGIKPEIYYKYMPPPYNDPNMVASGVKEEHIEAAWAKLKKKSAETSKGK